MIVKKINEEGLALTLLSESESMQSYTRKQFAMAFADKPKGQTSLTM